MAGEILFPDRRPLAVISFDLSRGPVLHNDIGHDSRGLDGTPLRGKITGRGQPERGAVIQGKDGLDRALAEGLRPQHDGPLVILQGARYDFGRAGAPPVDQDNHGKFHPGIFLAGKISLLLVIQPSFCVNNQPGIEEEIRHPDRLGQEAAWIVAKIENESSHSPLFGA